MIEIIPNWHPIWVHFAIALLFTSAGFFLIFGWKSSPTSGRENALIVARWTLRLGVVAAIVALLTGYLASGSVTHDDVSHANMIVHRNWAFATTINFAIVALIDFSRRTGTHLSILSVLMLVTGSVTLAMTGLEGAENVYQYGLGVQRLPDISTHEHSGGEQTSVHEHVVTTDESFENGAGQCAMDSCGDPSMHEQHEQENTALGYEEGVHDHDQSIADDPKSAADDDGHAHSHESVPEPAEFESTIKDSDHPASLLAPQLADAIKAGDVNSLRSVLAPDVLIFESGGVESSLAEYEGHHMPADMAFMRAMSREVISRQVIDSNDSATVVTRSRVHGTYKDQEIDLNSTETLVIRKVNGQWKVVHIHWSSS